MPGLALIGEIQFNDFVATGFNQLVNNAAKIRYRWALRRAGADLAIVSYGAYVHVALRVAERLATDGISASVLDRRSPIHRPWRNSSFRRRPTSSVQPGCW